MCNREQFRRTQCAIGNYNWIVTAFIAIALVFVALEIGLVLVLYDPSYLSAISVVNEAAASAVSEFNGDWLKTLCALNPLFVLMGANTVVCNSSPLTKQRGLLYLGLMLPLLIGAGIGGMTVWDIERTYCVDTPRCSLAR